MAWGQVTVGGITFREEIDASETGAGTLKIGGQEATPPQTEARVRAAHRNVIGLRGKIVPVVFTDKVELNGFYRVESSDSALTDFGNGRVVTASWNMTLERIGTERDVEFESRIPTIGRVDDLAGVQVPSFWHAPAANASGYYTGTTTPNTVVRTAEEGDLSVYFGLPTTVPPRWTAPADGFTIGSARVLLDGIRHAGDDTPSHAAWEVANGIIRVRPSGANLAVSMWRGVAGWSTEKTYAISRNGLNLDTVPEFTILRNEPEEVVVRLTYPNTPGRLTVDLSLRRGARFVTGIVKRHSAANLGVARTAAETANTFTGGLVATAADAEGVRFVMGSSKTPSTTSITTASMVKNSTLVYDFFLGAVFAAPVSGDAHTDLLLQYLGTTGDRTRVMRR